MPDYGDRIRAARERAGLTQRELAEAVGVSEVAVTLWENKKHPRRPGEGHWQKVTEILNLSDEATEDDHDKRPRMRAPKVTTYALNKAERALLDLFRSFPQELQLLQLANFVQCAKLRKPDESLGQDGRGDLLEGAGPHGHSA